MKDSDMGAMDKIIELKKMIHAQKKENTKLTTLKNRYKAEAEKNEALT